MGPFDGAKEATFLLKPTEPKKVLCIHDLSGVGRCSLAVILPVLSVMGIQPVALPTVVLSTHTGGFGTPARMDGGAYGAAALEPAWRWWIPSACWSFRYYRPWLPEVQWSVLNT